MTTTTAASTAWLSTSSTGRDQKQQPPMASGVQLAADPANYRGLHLETIVLDNRLLHPLSARGVAPTTIKGHRKVLTWMKEEVRLDLREAPLAMAIIELVNRWRSQRGWRWSTTTTKMATIQGAMANLGAYGSMAGGQSRILLGSSPAWKMAMKACARKAREERGCQPKAVSASQIRSVCTNTALPMETRAAIALSWLTAGRCGDVLKLRFDDVTLNGATLMVCWKRGKTVGRRGPYTVSTTCPAALLPCLASFAQRIPGDMRPAFPNTTGKALKLALRSTGDRALEQRSVRRGALQQLAAQGLPTSTLLLFSGHTTARMLMRYLGHGRHATRDQTDMIHAAAMALTMG
jgi:integrase